MGDSSLKKEILENLSKFCLLEVIKNKKLLFKHVSLNASFEDFREDV